MRDTRRAIHAGWYGVAGAIIGLCLPYLAWLLELGQYHPAWTLESWWQQHLRNPLHWIMDSAPLVMGVVAFYHGKARQLHTTTQHNHQFIETVLQTVDCLVVVVDLQGTIVRFNRRCEHVTGYRADEVLGHRFTDLFLVPHEQPGVQAVIDQLLHGATNVQHENTWRTKSGAHRTIAWSNTALHDTHQRITHLVGTGIDVTEQRRLEHEHQVLLDHLRHQATIDPLTGIANRRHFFTTTTKLLQTGASTCDVSVVLFDIDHFKAINDCYGHLVGDEVLQQIVERCEHQLRATDLLARYGGEEFVAMLPNTSAATAQQIAERLRATIADTPVETSRGPVPVTISGGVVERTAAHDDLAALLAQADHALYTAKQTGRNKIIVAAPAVPC